MHENHEQGREGSQASQTGSTDGHAAAGWPGRWWEEAASKACNYCKGASWETRPHFQVESEGEEPSQDTVHTSLSNLLRRNVPLKDSHLREEALVPEPQPGIEGLLTNLGPGRQESEATRAVGTACRWPAGVMQSPQTAQPEAPSALSNP